MDLKIIGDKIKKIRKNKGYTQIEFAHLCNFDRTYLSRIENGKQNITIEMLFLICDKLKIEPLEIFKK